MNICAAISVAAFVVGLAVAALAFGVAQAPRWARYRLLGAIALMAAVFCLGELPQSLVTSPAIIMPIARVQSVFAVLHVLAWQFYADRNLERTPGRAELGLRFALLVMALGWLAPDLMYRLPLSSFEVSWLGCTETFPQTTTLGSLAYGCELVVFTSTLARYLLAWRRGVYGAAVHAAAIAAMLFTGGHDVLVTLGLLRDPFLLSTGFLLSLAALGVLLARDFMREAEELDRLKQDLEQRVEDRTAELVTAEAALMRAEKLAAIGQLSAGVAHEVNNPAAVVRANLEWIREQLVAAAGASETIEAVDDSLDAIDRVAKIVRQLLDLGRAASSQSGSTMLARAVDRALAMAKTSIRAEIAIEIEVDDALWVKADEASAVQILVNLLTNGAQAIPPERSGTVRVVASATKDDVVVRVIDDGSGMNDETRRRAFEPFFTTKPFGQGTGLGLALSLGIARSLGGALTCASKPGETIMTLKLPRAASGLPTSESRLSAAVRRKLLLVEDDDRVRKALARMLSTPFALEVATGVGDAMTRLESGRFDVVLSDWRMPEGGGRKLYEDAVRRRPELASAFIFITGGGLVADDVAFLKDHLVLDKPLSLEKLLEAVEQRRSA